MPSKGTSVRGIRLADRVWQAIDEEAAALGMTRNELLGRRLRTAFSRGQDVENSDQIVESAVTPSRGS